MRLLRKKTLVEKPLVETDLPKTFREGMALHLQPGDMLTPHPVPDEADDDVEATLPRLAKLISSKHTHKRVGRLLAL